MLGGNTWPFILDRDTKPPPRLVFDNADRDGSRSAIFDGVLDEIFKDTRKFIRFATRNNRVAGKGCAHQRHAIVHCKLGQPIGDASYHTFEIGLCRWLKMLVEFDLGQREQIIDQPAHAPSLLGHDSEKLIACDRIVAGRALQGFDKTHDRGKRRAQFMAGIRHKIGTHRFCAAQQGRVMQAHDHGRGRALVARHPVDDGLDAFFDRHALQNVDAAFLAIFMHGFDGLEQLRMTHAKREGLATLQAGKLRTRRRVEFLDLAEHVNRHHRLGQAFEQSGLRLLRGAWWLRHNRPVIIPHRQPDAEKREQGGREKAGAKPDRRGQGKTEPTGKQQGGGNGNSGCGWHLSATTLVYDTFVTDEGHRHNRLESKRMPMARDKADTRSKPASKAKATKPAARAENVLARVTSFDIEVANLPKKIQDAALMSGGFPFKEKYDDDLYDETLENLQIELLKLQSDLKETGRKLVVVFEGRDGAGKGGAIMRVIEHLNPRSVRVVALAKPSDVEAGQWYFQRYASQFPTRGEMVLFDRSWYNRAGVERVFGFTKPEDTERFLSEVPGFESMVTSDGTVLLKLFLTIGREMQMKRLHKRWHDPLKRWKLSPLDFEAVDRWDQYSDAYDTMLAASNHNAAPWTIIRANDKMRARLAVIRAILGSMDYKSKNKKKIGKDEPGIVIDAKTYLAGGGEPDAS
jgi:polyphosphate kinase